MTLHHHPLKAKSVVKEYARTVADKENEKMLGGGKRRKNIILRTILLNETLPYKVLHQRGKWPSSVDLPTIMLPYSSTSRHHITIISRNKVMLT